MRFAPVFVATVFVLTSFLHSVAASNDPLQVVAQRMLGAFSNSEQARGDINFQTALLHTARFWNDHQAGIWVYAEQALPRALRHPYKQTVFQLLPAEDGAVECRLYDLADPLAATGGWKDQTILNNFTLEDLRLRENCTVILRAQPDGSFKGVTEGKGCANIRGAAYSTMEITVTDSHVVLWERGYNSNDVQIWGSLHGGYAFKRVESE